MSIFYNAKPSLTFDQANWEQDVLSGKSINRKAAFLEKMDNDNQFIIFQLAEGDQRLLSTTQVKPTLQGSTLKDVNMLLDFESFKIGSNEDIDRNTKATLQLQIGQEQNLDKLEKLFYTINGGLSLYNELKGIKTEGKEFKKSTGQAFGNKPISLPGGVAQLSLKVVKHEEPKWWQRVFSFAKTDGAKELLSLVGFPGITETAVNCVGNMLDGLFDKAPEILFQSQSIKLGFTQNAKEELTGGLSTNFVSCLNPGFWLMARKSDYKLMIDSKPVYYGGVGVLAPEGMSEVDAMLDSQNNPFSKLTYAVIRARMKEVDLTQGLLL